GEPPGKPATIFAPGTWSGLCGSLIRPAKPSTWEVSRPTSPRRRVFMERGSAGGGRHEPFGVAPVDPVHDVLTQRERLEKFMQLGPVFVAAEEQPVGVARHELRGMFRIARERGAAGTGGQIGVEVRILVEQLEEASARGDRTLGILRAIVVGVAADLA